MDSGLGMHCKRVRRNKGGIRVWDAVLPANCIRRVGLVMIVDMEGSEWCFHDLVCVRQGDCLLQTAILF